MRLADYLAKRGVTHQQFAQLIGTSQAAITRYANGQRTPRPTHLSRIAQVTKGEVTANDFVPAVSPPSRFAEAS